MSTEENKVIIHRWVDEAWNQGNVEILDDLTHPAFIDHHLPPDVPPNIEGHKAWIQMVRAGFPDIHITIEDVVVGDEKVAARMSVSGTHTGEFMGMPPSGKSIHFGAIGISRFTDGKSVEYWETFDALSMMQQIGALPSPG